MIYFVTPAAGAFGLFNYIEDWSAALGERIAPLSYESLLERDTLPAGSYAFSAFDQLTKGEIELVRRMRALLADTLPCAIALNDPARVLLRPQLLDALHSAGWNEFRAVRATGDVSGLRYPVFVREANQHTGSLTLQLADRRQLDRALSRLRLKGYRLDDLLAVEYCDTADEHGLYAKYSALIVGGRVMPRSVTFSTEWVTKHGGMVIDEERIALEYEYVAANPHEAWLADAFGVAGIEYGRIDYGMRDGRPQVWEINLNPTVARGPSRPPPTPRQQWAREARRPARDIFNAQFHDAWAAVDRQLEGEIPWRVEGALRRSIEAERRARARHARRIAKRASLFQLGPVRALARAVRG